MLDNQEGANTERYVFGKLSATFCQRRSFWHRHYYSNYCCGDIYHGKSAQGCVKCTVVYSTYFVRDTTRSTTRPRAASRERSAAAHGPSASSHGHRRHRCHWQCRTCSTCPVKWVKAGLELVIDQAVAPSAPPRPSARDEEAVRYHTAYYQDRTAISPTATTASSTAGY